MPYLVGPLLPAPWHCSGLTEAPALCVCSPIILDPADPTGILGQGKNWDLVAREAARHRSLPCVSAAQPWDVQVRLPVPAGIVPPPALPTLPTHSSVPTAGAARDN